MSVKKYLTLDGLTYFLNKIKSTVADELDGKSDVGHTHTKSEITDFPTLATVATSGDYDDLSNKPTINDSTITIQKNGSTVDTFTTNGSSKTIDIPVPTKTSDLTNDSDFVVSSSLATVATSGFYNDLDNKPYIPDKISDLIDDSNFVDTSNPAIASGITSSKVTDYDTHIADTDIHVTAEDKANWDSKQGSLSQDQLDAIAQVSTNTDDIATLQSDKADASHTHSSSDITDIDDYATKQYVDNYISDLVDNAPLDTLKELSTALNDDANFATTVTNALADKANSADLATVATSGSYDDLSDKPIIPDASNYYTKEEILALLEDYQRKGDKIWVD